MDRNFGIAPLQHNRFDRAQGIAGSAIAIDQGANALVSGNIWENDSSPVTPKTNH